MGKGAASGAVSDTNLNGQYFECFYDSPGHVEGTLEKIQAGPTNRAAISSFSFSQDTHNRTSSVSHGIYTNPLTGKRQAFYLEVAWTGGAFEGDSMVPVVLVGVGDCYSTNCKEGMALAEEMTKRGFGFPVEKTCDYQFTGFNASVGLIDRDKLPDVVFLPAIGSVTSAIVCYQREFDYMAVGKKFFSEVGRSLMQTAKALTGVLTSVVRVFESIGQALAKN